MNEYVFSTSLLLDIVIKVAVLLTVVWVGSLFIRKRSAAAQHRWWTLGFVGCLLLPAISFITPTWSLPILPRPILPQSMEISDSFSIDKVSSSSNYELVSPAPSSELIAQTYPLETLETRPQFLPVLKKRLTETISAQPIATTKVSEDAARKTSIADLLLILWILGLAICWFRVLWQHILLKRVLSGCVALKTSQWSSLLTECSQSLNLKRKVSLLMHRSAHSPGSTGMLHHAVILPENAEGWDVERRRLVVLHELAHVQRRDVLTQTLAGLTCGLYWFNPLCWYGLSQMRKLRELACDDLVLSCGQQPASYADVLLDVARSYRHKSCSTAVGMADSTNIESRITAILDATRRHVSLSRTAARLLLVVSAALVCLVGTAQLHSRDEPPTQQLVQQKPIMETTEEAQKQDANEPVELLPGFENEKQGFAQLLRSLDNNRIDYAKDSMSEVIQKQEAIRKLLGEFQKETVSEMAQVDLILNYVFMRNETSPRLTGRVINVGPKEQITSLNEALAQAKSGDCIRLGKGVFEIGNNRNQMFRRPTNVPTDIAIIGEGRDATKIKIGRRGQIGNAVRWRISKVSIDCGDNEVIYLRSGGSFEFINCKISNYNSGAGGSNAIGGSNVTLVVENTEMEGDSGRSSGRGGGSAFDLRGPNLLYVRKVHFEENSEVLRATFPCVFDRCTANGTDRNHNILSPYSGGTVLLKDNQVPTREGNNVSEFKYDVDDPKFVNLALGNREKLDARSEQIVKTLQLKRNPAYWIGLLRHPDVEIRTLAGERVETILPVKVKIAEPDAVVPNEEIDLAIKQLDDWKDEVRIEAAKRLEKFGKLAQSSLEEIAKSGTAEQRESAKQLIDRVSTEPHLPADIECGRLLKWFEQNRAKLKWSESTGKYQLAD